MKASVSNGKKHYKPAVIMCTSSVLDVHGSVCKIATGSADVNVA